MQYSKHQSMHVAELKLKLSAHIFRIRRLVKQLIFRLNQQQFRNNKYKKKDHSSNGSLSHRGASADNPIEVDEASVDPKLQSSSLLRPHTHHVHSPYGRRIVKLSIPAIKSGSNGLANPDIRLPRQQATNPITIETDHAAPPNTQSIRDRKDIYEVSLSPEPSNQTVRFGPM
jgi:hypothetical protein